MAVEFNKEIENSKKAIKPGNNNQSVVVSDLRFKALARFVKTTISSQQTARSKKVVPRFLYIKPVINLLLNLKEYMILAKQLYPSINFIRS